MTFVNHPPGSLLHRPMLPAHAATVHHARSMSRVQVTGAGAGPGMVAVPFGITEELAVPRGPWGVARIQRRPGGDAGDGRILPRGGGRGAAGGLHGIMATGDGKEADRWHGGIHPPSPGRGLRKVAGPDAPPGRRGP